MSDLNFEAEDSTIEKVLLGTEKFKIPRYQRPYAWGESEVLELWNDIDGDKESCFIGSFIFNREPLKETGYLDIIDGQQRILTLNIFMAALRDVMKTLDSEKSEIYHRHDICFEDRSGKENYRLEAGDTVKDYFRTHVQSKTGNILQSDPETKEEKRIFENYKKLHESISAKIKLYNSKDGKIEYLDALRKRVGSLIAIDIRIDNEEDAYEIFETTNARGVELSIADLLKNAIFKKMPVKEGKDHAKEGWDEIVENVEETNTEIKKFIRYHWISKKSFISEKQLFRVIKRDVSNWAELLAELRGDSESYRKLFSPEKDDWETGSGRKIFASLKAISLMKVSQCYVLLLSIARNQEAIGTDPARVFKALENFSFLYSVVCKLPGNRLEKLYSEYAIKIDSAVKKTPPKKLAGEINSIFDSLLNELKELKPSFEVFNDAFMNIAYKNSEDTRKTIKYILGKIEENCSPSREKIIDFDVVNIEHVLPQNPDKDWGLYKKDIKKYVNKLGNLTLVDKVINSKIGNKCLQEKVKELKHTGMTITKNLVSVIGEGEWGESGINMRQAEWSKVAYGEIWKL